MPGLTGALNREVVTTHLTKCGSNPQFMRMFEQNSYLDMLVATPSPSIPMQRDIGWKTEDSTMRTKMEHIGKIEPLVN